MNGATPGSYTIVLLDKNGNVLLRKPAAFVVQQGGKADIWVDFVGRDAMRAAKQQTFFILVGNKGNVDAQQGAGVWLSLPSYISVPPTAEFEPSFNAANDETTTLFYDVVVNIPVGGVITLPVALAAPDDPAFAHKRFDIAVWPQEDSQQ